MTKQQEKLIKLGEKKGSDADLLLLDEINEVDERVDALKDEIREVRGEVADVKDIFRKTPVDKLLSDEAKIERLAMRLATKIAVMEKGDTGDTGETGEDGHTPTTEELLALIRPLIPQVRDGQDGTDADEDKIIQEVLAKIQLPEQKEILLDDAAKIRDKLESLKGDEMLDAKYIKGLQNQIEELKNTIQKIPRGKIMGGSRKVPMTRVEDLTSQVNGVVTTYTLPRDTVRVHMVWSTQFPVILRPVTDFTFAGQTLTLTSAVGVIQSGQTLTCMIETLFYA